MRGFFFLLAAAFLFALSTVFLKLALTEPSPVSPSAAVFAQFCLGLAAAGAAMFAKKERWIPARPGWVLLRAAFVAVAIVLFFLGIRHTTVTKANLLNLTYPVYMVLLAPFINHEKTRWHQLLFLLTALYGSWLIITSGERMNLATLNPGDILTFASGIAAAFAICFLRESRKHDSTDVILFYQMGFGTVISGIWAAAVSGFPQGQGLLYVLAAAVVFIAAQFCLTAGYCCIDAVLGSIVLSSGIFFGAFLGISIFGDPLTVPIVLGGLLVLVSLVGVSGILEHRAFYKK